MNARSVALLSALFVSATHATNIYWDGVGGSWNTIANWSVSPSAPTPDPVALPGSSNTAIFNIDTVSAEQAVTLDANQALWQLSVLGTAVGGIRLTGGGADRALSLGAGGIAIQSGAGPVRIGSRAGGQGVAILMTANQTWTNGSDHVATVQNGIGATAGATLTLRGLGGFRLNGPGTHTNTTTVTTATLAIGHDQALGAGTLALDGCAILIEDFPRAIANRVLMNNGTKSLSGDGALTLTGSGSTPALAITLNAAPGINVVNTAPMAIRGIFSLCAATTPNNNPQGPSLASGANLTISADIWESNAGNSSNANNRGARFAFVGAGANLTLSGNNLFGAGASTGRSVDIQTSAGAGFNTVTVGGPGGSGATITPFGLSALFTNNGQGFYLKALENGQILGNNISLGGSVGNDGGRPIGFVGANDLTLGGNFSSTAALGFSIPNLASGTLTLAGTINHGANPMTFLGNGNTVLAATSVFASSGALEKRGPGMLTLAGANTSASMNTFRGGVVVLDYTVGNANRLGQNTTATALMLGGVDLQLKGGSHAQTLGAGGGTTLDFGQSRVRRDGGSSTIALGALARNAAGLVDFQSGVAETTTGNTSGTLGTGGFATVGGADWAAVSGGSIVALASYNSFAAPGADQNVLQVGGASIAGPTINTLKLDTTGAGQALTLASGTLTLNRRGLLFVGAHDYAITGGTVRGRDGYQEEMIVQQYGSGALTIASLIANRSETALVKAGPGVLALTHPANTYAGRTFINGGALVVSERGSLGSGGAANGLTFNGGTLRTTAGFATSRAAILGAHGGTFDVVAGTLEISGVVSGSYGALNKTGAGTLLLSGNNTFAGPVTVSDGALKLGHANALGPLNNASAASNRSISPVTVNGAVLDIAGFAPALGNLTLVSGALTDSVGGGTLGAYSFTLLEGTVGAVLTNAVVPNVGNPSHSVNLTKSGPGEAVIASISLYSGHTFVDGGVLRVNGALPNSPALVRGGTLGGVGSLARSVNVENSGALAPGASAATPGALTLGRHLRIAGGALRIAIGPSAYGQIVLTNPEARVLLANATLEMALLPGSVAIGAFRVMDNQGSNPVEGAFNGLPEGGVFNVGARRFSITYAGGDGNDVVLTAKQTGTLILAY